MKLPPREKIYEALSAIADNRITISDKEAKVLSSDKKKEYIVMWNDNKYSSNDNATYWQLYPGYPIIAILLLQNKILYNQEILKHFKNINWKVLNTTYKNGYTKAASEAFSNLNNEDKIIIEKEVNNIYNILEEIDLIILRSKILPPK